MSAIAAILVALVGLLHVYVLVLEMVLWTRPHGRKVFGMTPEFAQQTRVLAANQGLYNGFLAAGLFWSLLHPAPEFAWQIAMFFLACVAAAGIFGGATASPKILLVQTGPAVVAMLAVMFF